MAKLERPVISFRIDPEIHDWLKEWAAMTKMSTNTAARYIFRQGIIFLSWETSTDLRLKAITQNLKVETDFQGDWQSKS